MMMPARLKVGMLLLFVWGLVCPHGTVADDASPAALAARLRAARPVVVVTTAEDVQAALASLRQNAAVLDARLRADGANGERWKTYLLWGDLQSELAPEATHDPERISRIYWRFRADHAGLEQPEFVAVRNALARYAAAARRHANPVTAEQCRQRLASLAAAIESAGKQPGERQLREIAEHLSWLKTEGQCPNEVAAVRQQLWRPNLLVRVSRNVVATATREPIDETAPVRDVILETDIYGTGRTLGHTSSSLVPSEDGAVLQLELLGTNYSQTIGYNGPVRIYSRGTTTLHGRKKVAFDRDGLHTLESLSSASASTVTEGLASKFRGKRLDALVRRIACRKVQESKAESECIASRHAERDLNKRLDREVAEEIAKANAEYRENFLDPLVRLGEFPEDFACRTSADQLYVTILKAGGSQLAAPDDPIPLVAHSDLAAHVHESVVNNFAAGLLAGATITDAEVVAFQNELSGQTDPEEKPAEPDLAVILADTDPIKLSIDDNLVTLVVHGQRYVAQKRSYPPMNITICYRLEHVGGGARMTLVGEPEIVPPRFTPGGQNRYSFRETALKRILTNFLNRDLDKEIVSDGIELEGSLKALGKMPIVQLVGDDGWLTFACRSETPAPESVTSSSAPGR